MKHSGRYLIVLTLVIGIILPVSIASARITRINYSGSELCDSDSLTVIREWMAGPNYQGRGLTQVCYDTANIPQMTGKSYLSDGKISFVGSNGILIMTGKVRIVSDEGGSWVGSWTFPANSDTVDVIGFGEGIYEGLQFRTSLSLEGAFSGFITER